MVDERIPTHVVSISMLQKHNAPRAPHHGKLENRIGQGQVHIAGTKEPSIVVAHNEKSLIRQLRFSRKRWNPLIFWQ